MATPGSTNWIPSRPARARFFHKSYRNRHLLNIWAEAQQTLAKCGRWVFVGYSLPDDDIHIKGLLLKAKRMRIDSDERPPEVQVVTHNPDQLLRERYQRLFGSEVKFDPAKGGFATYVEQRVKTAARKTAERERRARLEAGEAARRAAKRRRSRAKRAKATSR